MTLSDANVGAILLDIGVTTKPIEIVYDVLLPFAHQAVRELNQQHYHSRDVRDVINALRQEHQRDRLNIMSGQNEEGLEPPPWNENSADAQRESVTRYVYWLMDQDR